MSDPEAQAAQTTPASDTGPAQTSAAPTPGRPSLVLRPFRALRPVADGADLAKLLCPPYDVIDPALRRELLAVDGRNAVSIVLPEGGDDRYRRAAELLEQRVDSGLYAVDPNKALYVYEMRTPDGHVTRGLVGAVELRDPDEGVILPHENTMAGPVADRLAIMRATETDLEPIYLIYDGGGAASRAVEDVDGGAPIAQCTTRDGVRHRLWSINDPEALQAVAADLSPRRAMIADGHHRYATYRALQAELAERGPGAWDAGLTLLVDSTTYGPEVHAIHRYVAGLTVERALTAARSFGAEIVDLDAAPLARGLERIAEEKPFAVVVTDGRRSAVVIDRAGTIRDSAAEPDEPPQLSELDITVLHRALLRRVWQVSDDEQTVGYAHTVDDAVAAARAHDGCAVLVRPTPLASVAAVAAAGGRMPRKSTSFTPKPASGLFMRRFLDD